MKIAVFVSGNGSNLEALLAAEKKNDLAGAEIALVVSDKSGAYALERARKYEKKTFILEKKDIPDREEYDKKIAEELEKEKIDFVVLAGFMRILSKYFVAKYQNRLLNVHPALLPAFKGAHGIKDAHDYGVKVTGVTVHFVTNELDSGPIILQKAVQIKEGESIESLEKRIHRTEHLLYPEAVRLFAEGKIETDGKKVRIKKSNKK
ncbi:MAG TPA: phosphoribosylglycinamide formyltransferase [Candidatus Omnitrophota bacterium]|nr:phosphoribosylglycinamide formyltransferase [Candidatus Omnitrophota bacterium]HPS19677.1 phosphoribosylglycinamide formyltransferase [Candidatus Omnitrophota bacterium]